MPRRIPFFDVDAECGASVPHSKQTTPAPPVLRDDEPTRWSDPPTNNGRPYTAPHREAHGARESEPERRLSWIERLELVSDWTFGVFVLLACILGFAAVVTVLDVLLFLIALGDLA